MLSRVTLALARLSCRLCFRPNMLSLHVNYILKRNFGLELSIKLGLSRKMKPSSTVERIMYLCRCSAVSWWEECPLINRLDYYAAVQTLSSPHLDDSTSSYYRYTQPPLPCGQWTQLMLRCDWLLQGDEHLAKVTQVRYVVIGCYRVTLRCDWLLQGDEHLAKVTEVRYVVVDEADRMIEKGHFHELTALFQLINSNEYVQWLSCCY